MAEIPDLSDPRYLQEVGYFLMYEKYLIGRDRYPQERIDHSRNLLSEVLTHLERDESWLLDKAVISLGCGCSGDLLVWNAAVKIGVDPLLYTYQKLDLLGTDVAGPPTVALSIGMEDLPLLDDSIDLIVSRNSLDHVPDPAVALAEMTRILKPDGTLFLGVDIGGPPTADEPSPFSQESLQELLDRYFDVHKMVRGPKVYSENRDYSVRVVASSREKTPALLDKDKVLAEYERQSNWYPEETA